MVLWYRICWVSYFICLSRSVRALKRLDNVRSVDLIQNLQSFCRIWFEQMVVTYAERISRDFFFYKFNLATITISILWDTISTRSNSHRFSFFLALTNTSNSFYLFFVGTIKYAILKLNLWVRSLTKKKLDTNR